MSEPVTLVAAFMIGLVGSSHCLGMCGGIAGAMGMSAARQEIGGVRLLGFSFLYNLGRLVSYGVAGALIGALGASIGALIDVPFWTVVLRTATGLILVAIGLQIAFRLRLLGFVESAGARIWQRLTPLASRLLAHSSPGRALGLGLLWGWLPCGLVYSVLLAAAVAGGPVQGAGVMLAFGLGTLPAMVASAYTAARLSGWTRDERLRLAAGCLLLVFGVWTAMVPLQHLGHRPQEGQTQHQHQGH